MFRLALFALLAGLLFGVQPSSAQNNRTELQRFVQGRTIEFQGQRAADLQRLSRLGMPLKRRVARGRQRDALVAFQRFVDGRPIYYFSDNVDAADTVGSDELWPGGGLGLSLDGSSQILGIWDAGNVRDTHQEFTGRVTNLDSAGLSNHSTHVAGTMIGAGIDADAIGMAFAGSLRAYDWNSDEVEMAAEQLQPSPLIVSNHSYSFISGWFFNFFADGLWTWFGDATIGITEDSSFGRYEQSAANWDQIAVNAPNYLMVKSAGNDRGDSGPTEGALHWHFDSIADSFVLSFDTHPADGGGSGYDTIAGGSASSKNVLTVGAVSDIFGGYQAPDDVVMTSFSGWGPTDDGRIKPDLVANGVGLRSSLATGDAAYGSFSGTSMAAPNVSGTVGLLAQHADLLFGAPLKSATMKGLMIHTASEAGTSPGPDYSFGWGLLNAEAAAQLMSDDADATASGHIFEVSLANGGEEVLEFESDGTGPLRVTIVWTDPTGTPQPDSVDPLDLVLVNDLDVTVVDPSGSTHFPFVLNPLDPSAAATTGDNFRDNVEQIHLATPTPGIYTVRIAHKGALAAGVTQPFSVIVSGNLDSSGPPPPAPLSITTSTLPSGTVGISYGATLAASGGQAPYSWSVVAGALPDGLDLPAASDQITGTPVLAGTFGFTVEVSDSVGATAQLALEIIVAPAPPPAPAEIIVDNLDPEASATGTWSGSSGASPWAGGSVYNNGGQTFKWQPGVPVSGTYEVYAWWTHHANRSSSVPYRISHDGGVDTVMVNQSDTALGGQWNLLGTYNFTAGGGGYVEVSSENGQALADAVRLLASGPPP